MLASLASALGCGESRQIDTARTEGPEEIRTPDLIEVIGGVETEELFGIKAAAFSGLDLAVLTTPEPAVHLFAGGQHRAWGKKGSGPAELENPGDLVWVGNRLLVRDFRLGKVVSYDTAGNFVAARSYGPAMANRLEVANGDTLLALFLPDGPRTVVRLRGEQQDTVLSYNPESAEQIYLQAEGSPSLTLNAPFAPLPTWVALPSGKIAFWDGQTPELLLLNFQGDTVSRLPLPATPRPVSPRDREGWFGEGIPVGDFMGRGDIFRPLREKAREQVRFPPNLPLVLALLPDPGGGVWVQRSPAASGQLWTHVDTAGTQFSMQLPPGRKLLAIGESRLAVAARDELDVETLELYRKLQRQSYEQ